MIRRSYVEPIGRALYVGCMIMKKEDLKVV